MDQFTGEISQGLREGQRPSRNARRSAYEGTWKAGEINGEGQLSQKNGDVYTGTLVNGRREGLGK